MITLSKEDVNIAVVISNKSNENIFSGFKRDRTRDLCVNATVLCQLGYKDAYIGSKPIF